MLSTVLIARPANRVLFAASPRGARSWADCFGVLPRLRGPASIVGASLSLHTAAALAVVSFAAFGAAATGALRFAVRSCCSR